MFDHSPTYVNRSQHTHIRVEQQPNDAADAARLHGEIKQKAEQEIIQSVHIEGNGFNAVLHIALECVSNDKIFRAIYDLNGKRVVTNYTHKKDWLSDEDDRPAAIRGLLTRMSEDIAREVLMVALEPHIKARTF